jgi:hypothetical protein
MTVLSQPAAITDRDIANLCADIYLDPDPVDWSVLELPPDGIAFGIKDFGPAMALIFRGSVTLTDWLRDAEVVADPFMHDDLGPVHPGFFEGLPELWARLSPTLTTKPCIVAGHSLGAGRASLFTGLMVLDGHPPIWRLCFGEPRPAFPQAASIIVQGHRMPREKRILLDDSLGRRHANGNEWRWVYVVLDPCCKRHVRDEIVRPAVSVAE